MNFNNVVPAIAGEKESIMTQSGDRATSGDKMGWERENVRRYEADDERSTEVTTLAA
jgi:hypothetical protein